MFPIQVSFSEALGPTLMECLLTMMDAAVRQTDIAGLNYITFQKQCFYEGGWGVGVHLKANAAMLLAFFPFPSRREGTGAYPSSIRAKVGYIHE